MNLKTSVALILFVLLLNISGAAITNSAQVAAMPLVQFTGTSEVEGQSGITEPSAFSVQIPSIEDFGFARESVEALEFAVTSIIRAEQTRSVRDARQEVGSDDYLANSMEVASDSISNVNRSVVADSYTATNTLPLDSEGTDRETSSIRVSLYDNQIDTHSYNVLSGEGGIATATAFDDDLQVFSIEDAPVVAKNAASVGSPTTAWIDPLAPLKSRYTPEQIDGEKFLTSAVAQMPTYAGLAQYSDVNDNFSGTLEIPLGHTIGYTGKGSISVSLDPESASLQSHKVLVASNADAPPAFGGAVGTQTAAIAASSIPELSITAKSESFAENAGPAVFVVKSDIQPASSLKVWYRPRNYSGQFLSSTENFLKKHPGLTFTENDDGEYTAEIEVALIDDYYEEVESGEIEVILRLNADQSGTYTIDSEEGSARTTITDNDYIPTLSVENANIAYEIKGNATFAVTNLTRKEANLTVRYSVENVSGNFLPAASLNKTLTQSLELRKYLNTGTFIAGLRVDLDDDMTPEGSGIIRVTILPDTMDPPTYWVGENRNTATVIVIDNDTPTNIELFVSSPEAVTESQGHGLNEMGEPVLKFPVTANINPGRSINVNYNVRNVARNRKFIADDDTGDKSQVLTFTQEDADSPIISHIIVPLDNDTEPDRNGRVQLQLRTGASYYGKYGGLDAYVWVFDDDVPVLSIGNAPAVAENAGPVRFPVTSSKIPSAPLIVEIVPSNVTGNFMTPDNIISNMSARLEFEETESGTYADFIEIPIPTNSNAPAHGEIRVTMYEVAGIPDNEKRYLIADDSAVATAKIYIDLPVLSITAKQASYAENGGPAEFEISSPIRPSGPVMFHYTPAEVGEGDFLTDTVAQRQTHSGLTLNSTSGAPYTGTLQIPLDNDDVEEASGSISVTLHPVDGDPPPFLVHGANFRATVNITDDDLPELSIFAESSTIVESSGTAVFTIKSHTQPDSALKVRYTPAEVSDGDFLTNAVTSVTTHPGLTFRKNDSDEYVASLFVSIDNDEVDEENGSITVTLNLNTQDSGTYSVHATDNVATVNVIDDDVPQLSIANATALAEDEGPAGFTIKSDIAPKANLTVRYRLANVTGNFISQANSNRILTASPALSFTSDGQGGFESTLNVLLDNDTIPEINGEVRVTIVDDTSPATYEVVEANKSATVKVSDDDSAVPVLSIANVDFVVESEESVDFTVTASVNPMRPVTVSFTPSEVASGDFLTDMVAQDTKTTLNFSRSSPSDPYTDEITVALHNDNVGEVTGSIIVTLNADPETPDTYTVATGQGGSATATIYDDDAPEISIANATAVAENSGPARFAISSRVQPRSALMINYTPSEVASGDFLTDTVAQATTHPGLTLSSNGSGLFVKNLDIVLDNDEVDEADGSIMVTLNSDPQATDTYKVKSGAGSATASITDDDIPELSIAASAATYSEGTGSASFTLTASIAPKAPLKVRYTAAEVAGGDFLKTVDESTKTHAGLTFSNNGSNVFTTPLAIPLDNDEVDETNGSISVSLSLNTDEPGTYSVHGTNGTATVAVTDDDVPQLSIAATAATYSEATGASFTLTASIQPKAPLKVRYTASEVSGGDFLKTVDESTKTHTGLTFSNNGSGPFTAILTIPLDNDAVDEVDGSISVALSLNTAEPGTYTVHGVKSFATVAVTDDDVPTLSIAATAATYAESTGSASFTLTASIQPNVPLKVRYTASEVSGGDFLKTVDEATKTHTGLTFSNNGNGPFTAILAIPLDNDDVDEADGSISVALSLNTVETGTYSVHKSNDTATVAITDDDVPVLSIANATALTESSGPVLFTVTASIRPLADLTVRYRVENIKGDFLPDSSLNKILTADPALAFTKNGSGDFTSILRVALEEDPDPEINGSVRVTLVTDTAPITYAVTDATKQATVVVNDDDSTVPILSVEDVEFAAESDGSVEFTVISNIDPGRILVVHFTPAEVDTGDFLTVMQAQKKMESLQFSRAESDDPYSDTITVNLHNDGEGEVTGSIMVTLNDDPATPATYLVATGADGSATAVIYDDDAPEISIANAAKVAENMGPARFVISARVEPTGALQIRYTPSEVAGGDFLTDAVAQATTHAGLTLNDNGNGLYVKSLDIALHDDNVDEADGSIMVTLHADPLDTDTYKVKSTAGSATATIADDDVPVLSIASTESTYAESTGSASFTLTASIEPKATLKVRYTAAEVSVGDFLKTVDESAKTHAGLAFSNNGNGPFTAILAIPLDNDGVDEADGSISVALSLNANEPGTYSVHESNGTATVAVTDDDVPRLSIAATSTTYSEGTGSVSFTLTASIEPKAALKVRYTAAEVSGGDFLKTVDESAKTHAGLTFSNNGNGPFTAILAIPLDNDGVDETDGSISVALSLNTTEPGTYSVHASNSTATVEVSDDDLPELSIAATAATYSESTGASFTLTASIEPKSPLKVRYTASEVSGGDFLKSVDEAAKTHTGLTFSNNGSGPFMALLAIPLDNDGVDEADGSISVSLSLNTDEPGTYSVHASNGTTTVAVTDDDVPELSIAAEKQRVSGESGRVRFLITASIEPKEPLQIRYASSEMLDGFVGINSPPVETTHSGLGFSENDKKEFIAVLEIQLQNVYTEQKSGSLRVILTPNSDSPGTYSVNPQGRISNVAVFSVDIPELSVAAANATVAENTGEAEFVVTASIQPRLPLTVHYTPMEVAQGDFLDQETEKDSKIALTFRQDQPDDPFTAKIPVLLDNDTEGEPTGMIKLALKEDPANPVTYSVAAGDGGSASVTVLDDDAPVLKIQPGPQATEAVGAVAVFNITAAVAPNGDITVNFTPSDGDGDFLGSGFSDGVAQDQILKFTGTQATLSVAIEDDMLDENHGRISVTLNEDPATIDKYSIDSVQTAVVDVQDDDRLPLLSFAEESLEVDEADGVMEFVLNLSPVSGRQVRVEANTRSDDADAGLDYQAVSKVIVFEAGTSTRTISVSIFEDFDHEEAETVELILTNVINARFANNESTVQKSGMIMDNDLTPRVFITPDKQRIMEGETVTFTVESSKIAETDLIVHLVAVQDGDYVIWPIPRFVTIAAGDSTTEFKVPTYEDMQDTLPEGDYGNITVMVLDQQSYNQAVSSDEKTSAATVQIEDRGVPGPGDITTKYTVVGAVIEQILLQIPETVPADEKTTAPAHLNKAETSISATRVSVNEGEVVEFQVSVKPEAGEDLKVSLLLEDTGDFIGGRNSAVVNITKGQSAGLLLIQTVDDEIAERNGVISATILAGSGYRVSNASSASVEVLDGDDRAELQAQVEEVYSELLQSTSANTLKAASSRFSHSLAGSEGSTLALNGQTSPASWLKSQGDSINSGSITWQSILDDTSFAVELFPEAGLSSRATFWGTGSKREKKKFGSGNQIAGKGEEFAGHLGLDLRIGTGMLAGFAVANTESDVEFGTVDEEKVQYTANSVAIQPYLGFQSLNNNTSMLFSVGYGSSELGIDRKNDFSANLNGHYHTIGFEGSSKLYSSDSSIPSGSTGIQLTGKTALAESFVDGIDGLLEKTQAQTMEFQLAIEGSHQQDLIGIGALSPSLYFGARGKGKNGYSSISLETRAQSRFDSNFGLKINGEGEMLFSNLNRIRQWGVFSSLEYDLYQDGLGVLFDLSPAWGWTRNSNNESFFNSTLLKDGINGGQQVKGSKVELEIGYGLAALDGWAIITPYGSLELADGIGNVHQIGSRLGVGSNLELELESTWKAHSGGKIEDSFKLNGNYEW